MNFGFVDLRTGRDQDRAGDQFWPSFTDIMTVIVMVFLLASVVLVVRNWQLMEDLKESVAAERAAWESLRSKTEENQTLEEQLTLLRMQLMRAQELAAQQRERIARLETARHELGNALTGARERLGELERLLAARDAALAAGREREASLEAEIARLNEARTAQEARIAELEAARQAAAERLAGLQGEYDTLRRKYDRLVRPARTPKGKHVVTVRYRKRDGRPEIRFRDQGMRQDEVVSRDELERRLGRLARQHPGRLYVKIIIPADSGLSYAEAWRFMKEILERYDYWYQLPSPSTPAP